MRGGTSTIKSPCHVISNRSPSVTSPITVTVTSHFLQIAKNRSICFGSTIAHIRSCDSDIKISSGDKVASRSGTRSSSTFMPPLPPDANSLVAQDKPAPPRSWMPTTKSSANISSEHSIKTFSTNGSPTCTAGRLAGPEASKVSDARTDTPPIPSPPVLAPYKTTKLPAPAALASLISLCFITPTQSAFTSGLPIYVSSKTTSPPMFGRPKQFP